VTFTIGKPPRHRPRSGDTKVIRGVLHIRRQSMCRAWPGAKLSGLVNNGRPVYEWVRVDKEFDRG
jgi:hypothetical protein